jgi:mono/diheme cytochrome c family protein
MSQMPSSTPEQDGQSSGGVFAVLILFGLLAVVLVAVLSGQVIPAGVLPPPTEAPDEVAAAPTTVAAQPTIASLPPTVQAAPTEAAVVEVAQAQPAAYTEQAVAAGGQIYAGLCFACHGMDGRGVLGLGKTLIDSPFVTGQTDAQLVTFLNVGRGIDDPLNSTGQVMPAKGGNPALTDADMYNVVAYIRSLNGAAVGDAPAQQVAEAPTEAAQEPVVQATVRPFQPLPLNALDASVIVPAAGASGELALPPLAQMGTSQTPERADGSSGAAAYAWSCSTCHADRAALAQTTMTDDEIFAMLTLAQPPQWGLNAYTHAYRGGHPELTDAELQALIAYLRSGQ